MIKNKKGYSLLEVMVTVLIIAILAGIGTPYYIAVVEKTRIATNIPIIKAVQDAVVQYYPEAGFPATLRRLHITLGDGWDSSRTEARAVKIDGSCTITLDNACVRGLAAGSPGDTCAVSAPCAVNYDCRRNGAQDWQLRFEMNINSGCNLVPGSRFFIITAGDNSRANTLRRAARSSGWQQEQAGNTFRM